jgi:hypothetical protein
VLLVIEKNCPKEINLPIGEKSPNLVTLVIGVNSHLLQVKDRLIFGSVFVAE